MYSGFAGIDSRIATASTFPLTIELPRTSFGRFRNLNLSNPPRASAGRLLQSKRSRRGQMPKRICGQDEREDRRAGPRLQLDLALHQPCADGGEIEALPGDCETPRVEPGEIEQVSRELLQPRHLLAGLVQELRPCLGVEILARQQLEEAAEREQRRAQLVRGVGDEVA